MKKLRKLKKKWTLDSPETVVADDPEFAEMAGDLQKPVSDEHIKRLVERWKDILDYTKTGYNGNIPVILPIREMRVIDDTDERDDHDRIS